MSQVNIDPQTNCISLSGEWRFALDPDNIGQENEWYTIPLTESIQLPGILQDQGYGEEIGTNTPWVHGLHDRRWYKRKEYKAYTEPGNVRIPFISQPPRHYLGAAWYQQDIVIPPEWDGKRVQLILERARWQTTVWLNDHNIGTEDSLCVPHSFDLGIVQVGTYTLTIRVDNRVLLPYRPDSHGVSDSTGNSWNGIAGSISLVATSPVWLDNVQVFPDVAEQSLTVDVTIGNCSGKSGYGQLTLGDEVLDVQWDESGCHTSVALHFDEPVPLWDEFQPAVQQLTVRLNGQSADDQKTISYGWREFRADGQDFILNGRKTNFIGVHEGGMFPLTGYPPTDVSEWKRIFQTCKEWGFNHMRFHSWCPPRAAFIAADELGFYLQPECGMWNMFQPDGEMEAHLHKETERIIQAFGNHPSFLMFSPGNEPGGNWVPPLTKWVETWRRKDKRRLYTANSGWMWLKEPGPVQGTDFLYIFKYSSGLRLRGPWHGWFDGDYREAIDGLDVPVLAHEIGQYCAYPDFEIISKFTGYMRPDNFRIFRDSLEAKGMLEMNERFARSSGKFQVAAYKQEIEANLRTPGLSGFEMLDLHDYLGQGAALVGVLDAFWESKGYVDAKQFRRFCSQTVPLARLSKAVWTTAETLRADVEIAHFGAETLKQAIPYWRLMDAKGTILVNGKWEARDIPIGKNTVLGQIHIDLAEIPVPSACQLVVGIEGTEIENDWECWIYPAECNVPVPETICLTHSFSEATERLAAGDTVLYVPRQTQLDWSCPPLNNTPVFWNKQMGPSWVRNLGLYCDPEHPAFAQFPTDDYLSWQWLDLVSGQRAMNLDRLARDIRPIIQPIDDWNRNYKLAYAFEARVGKGRLLVCSLDIESDLANRPVARQLRQSLLAYMDSEAFQPHVSIAMNDLHTFMFDTLVMKKLGAQATASSAAENAPANHVIDGDPNTVWISAADTTYPHELEITFPQAVEMSGIVCVQRQNDANRRGHIEDYTIQARDEGAEWETVCAGKLESTFDPQTITFDQTVRASRLKFIARSAIGKEPVDAWHRKPDGWYFEEKSDVDHTASLAQLAVVHAAKDQTAFLDSDAEPESIQYARGKSTTAEMDE